MANPAEPIIEPVSNPEDLAQAFYATSEAFGRQIKDSLWIAANPGWDTPKGQEEGTARFIKRFESITTNKDGQPNTIFVKATLPDPKDEGKRRVVGLAVWQQFSFVEGWGDPPTLSLGDMEKQLDPTEARFAKQMMQGLFSRRVQYVKEIAETESPAVFALDMCLVDPAFQKRGIAGKLVQWGLGEAKRRGGLESTTEASAMGRHVYKKLGFEYEGQDFVYPVDEEFKSRYMPPNVFMKTGR
ncbi:hypothetical protein BDV96DRAFT_642330 [Lophiotrema nucula]|uniref:N-acetyltransferase domain-containing protein n=1 Tax=Lophiotrema nucula TaxID=690887 RepID=A0A6A5ZJT6_9PLEO|nr:hypothetical protein BDV96DRAFT_642330 [Lophiotrema nucula]